jgi:hypothetical protein
MSSFADMAVVRIFKVMSDKRNLVGTCSINTGRYAQNEEH